MTALWIIAVLTFIFLVHEIALLTIKLWTYNELAARAYNETTYQLDRIVEYKRNQVVKKYSLEQLKQAADKQMEVKIQVNRCLFVWQIYRIYKQQQSLNYK